MGQKVFFRHFSWKFWVGPSQGAFSKLPAYNGAFSLTVVFWSFFAYSWSFCAYNWSSLLTIELLCLQWESASNQHLNGL